MMDVREAISTLNAYSMSIAGKTRLCENSADPGAPEEAKKAVEGLIPTLKAEAREAKIILIMVEEEVSRNAEQMVVGFTGELAELIKAINRSHDAIHEARKFTIAHQEKTQLKDPRENPTAKAINEFLEKHGRRPN